MILVKMHLGSRVLAVGPTTPAVRAEPYLHLADSS
jgi:hypothetical protein